MGVASLIRERRGGNKLSPTSATTKGKTHESLRQTVHPREYSLPGPRRRPVSGRGANEVVHQGGTKKQSATTLFFPRDREKEKRKKKTEKELANWSFIQKCGGVKRTKGREKPGCHARKQRRRTLWSPGTSRESNSKKMALLTNVS